MMFISILTALLMGSASCWAQVQKWNLGPKDQVRISLSKAQVNLNSSRDSSLSLQLGASCRALESETREGELILREQDLLKPRSETAVCQVQITAPSQGLRLHVLEGSIQAQKLSGDFLLHLQKGKLSLREGSGSLTVHAQKGDISIQDFQGSLRVDSQQASSQIRQLQGDFDLASWSGEHLLEKSKGNFRVLQASGSLKVVGGQGVLQIDSLKSKIETQAFAGRIEGQSQEGTLQLNLTSDPDVHLRGQNARFFLSLPAQSGAFLQLVTQEGELLVPASIQIQKEGLAKSVKQRWKGEAAKGSVIVRNQEGLISLK